MRVGCPLPTNGAGWGKAAGKTMPGALAGVHGIMGMAASICLLGG